jgi:transcriptional regulator with GAF, ATPase, and Fis domain
MSAAPEPLRLEVEPDSGILGRSPAIRRALALARRFAPTDIPILLKGETGTGKELFARAIHAWSGRSGQLVDLNCATLPREMVDALLFGHRRGAFTGAVETMNGLVEAANGGTLFLDELMSLSSETQAKFLRVLESGELRRIGESSKRRVQFRTVAAVQEDLHERVDAGQFRLDLLQRLAGIVIELPPLGERGDDVLLLAGAFAEARGRELGTGAEAVLRWHQWRGNIRELRGVVERAVCLTHATELDAEVIAESIELGCGDTKSRLERGSANAGPETLTRARLLDVCAANHWDTPRLARALGVRRTKLFSLLKRFGVSIRAGRAFGEAVASCEELGD